MKMRLAALLCTLTATACASSDPPAQAPSTATATQGTPATYATASTTGSTSVTSADTTGAATAPGRRLPGSAGNATGMGESTPNATPEFTKAERDATKADAGVASFQATSDRSPGATGNQPDTSSARSPDNSAVNQRDRHATLTPMDQGGKDGERQVTAAIRRAVVAEKSLSFTAKNVKIITVGSKVTLRGTVKTDQERSTIETLARQSAGVTEVDNQVEVKGK